MKRDAQIALALLFVMVAVGFYTGGHYRGVRSTQPFIQQRNQAVESYRSLAASQAVVITAKDAQIRSLEASVASLTVALKKAQAVPKAKKVSLTDWTTTIATGYGIGDGLMGKPIAAGGPLTNSAVIVAHPSLPLRSWVEVEYNGRRVVARVMDRGPAAWTGHGIDLAPATARALHFPGHSQVRYRVVKGG